MSFRRSSMPRPVAGKRPFPNAPFSGRPRGDAGTAVSASPRGRPLNGGAGEESVPARILSYVDAIREATEQEMVHDPSVIVFGLDVDDPKMIQGTTRGLLERFGPERVFGTPLSEDAMTGAAIGMALAGLRPIHVHIRMHFLMLAMNQLVNVAA